MSAPKPAAVVGDLCGESPLWSADESAVYWVDILGALIHRLTWPECRLTTWQFEESPASIALSSEPGRMMVALASRLIWWWPLSGRRAEHGCCLDEYPLVRFNEGRPDPWGRFWAGTMYNDLTGSGTTTEQNAAPDRGKLFRVDVNGQANVMLSDIGISNTLCWSPDRATLYFADSMRNVIRRFAFDGESGRLSNGETHLAGYPKGVPDGSAVDAEGFLWNCRWGGAGLVRIDPAGCVDAFHPMPTLNLTSCTFGGADLDLLFVTSARLEAPPGDRFAGTLWVLEAKVRGLPENRVRVPDR